MGLVWISMIARDSSTIHLTYPHYATSCYLDRVTSCQILVSMASRRRFTAKKAFDFVSFHDSDDYDLAGFGIRRLN